MKKLALTYFAVKRISNNVPATEFNRTDLETAARTSRLTGWICSASGTSQNWLS
jgi:hypothetical protein